jgi:TATA-box binding protein (TBP) (component of TFIID and TFIIIB)
MSGAETIDQYRQQWLGVISTAYKNAVLGINIHDPNSATLGDIPICAFTGGYIFPQITNIVMTGMDCVTPAEEKPNPDRKRSRNQRNKSIDLLKIAQCTPGADLNPHRFAAARMTLRANLCGREERELQTVDFPEKSKCESFLKYILDTKTFDRASAKRAKESATQPDLASRATGLYFDTGKYVVTGTSSEFQALMAIQLIVDSYSRSKSDSGKPCPELDRIKTTWPKCNVENVVASMQLFPPPRAKLDLMKISKHLGSECTYEPDLFPGVIYRPLNGGNKLRCFLLFESSQAVLAGSRNEKEVFSEFKIFVDKIYKINF